MGEYMKALILCDGYGKEQSAHEGGSNALFVLTDGFMAIDKLLIDLAAAEFHEAMLLTSVASRQLQEKLGTEHKGVRLSYEHGSRTAKDVGFALTKMDDDVVVVDSGVVTDINFKKMMTKFAHSAPPLMAYVAVRAESTVLLDRLSEALFGNEFSAVYGGIFCVRKGFDLGGFALGEELEEALHMLADLGQLDTYEESNFWDTLYTEDGKKRVREEFRNKTVKPWGYEKVHIITELYLLKELYIREGFQSSYHFHKNKDETMLILHGDGFIQFEDRKEYFKAGDTIRIKPYEKHTIVANTDTTLYEASTPFLEDTTRVKDFYPVR